MAKRQFRLIPALVLIFVAGVLLAVGGFAFASTQEAHDAFCASCHSQPESTFYERSTGAQAVDLASYHQPKEARCIDCHSGKGVSGRVVAELMGARNAFKWYTGTAVQPAELSTPIGDQNCLKCHQDVTRRGYVLKEQITIPAIGRMGTRGGEEEGGIGHWHQNLARWQSISATAGSCVSCHPGHQTGETAESGFMNGATVQAVCEACHEVIGGD